MKFGQGGSKVQKPDDILDRHREWEALTDLWRDPEAQLVFTRGRRRVGKSWLLQRFAHRVAGLYYQATRRGRQEQLDRMTGVVGEYFQDPALRRGAGFSDWEALFEYVTDRAEGDRFLFVIDEFPYLAREDPGLTSTLQSLWDHRWKGRRFKLILCGSHITFMRRLEEHDQPLHSRRTARLHISPFTYRDTARFVPDYSSRDQLRTYGIFGGVPGHLDRLDPTQDLAANVADLVLTPSGLLSDEATHLLDSFTDRSQIYYSVLFAIGTGANTWGEIASRVERAGGALRRVIEWLRDMELIQREVPATKDQPQKSKVSQYRISDPYLRFWHRQVQPLYVSGALGVADPEALWRDRIEPRLDDYMGRVFEDACRTFAASSPDFPVEPLRVGRWWTRTSEHEVDVVVRGVDDRLFVGECKWGEVYGSDLRKLRERGRMIADEIGGGPEITFGLFSGSGERDEVVEKAVEDENVHLWQSDDLFW